MRGLCWLVVLLPIGCFAQDAMERGAQHFQARQYPDAVNDFREAVTADPNNVKAHLYLGTALDMQFIPGADTPENLQFATDALVEFRKVLDLDSSNVLALASIATLYYNEKKFAEATEWNEKVIAVDPNNKEAYYTLGVIAWSGWLPVDRQARVDSGQKPEDPGPIAKAQLRESLKAMWIPILDKGIDDMRHALQISPDYSDAMTYLNLLIRYRADLDDTPEQWRADTATAIMWMQKAMEAKKLPNARIVPEGAAPQGGVMGGVIGGIPSSAIQQSHPGEIRMGANVVAANLINKVEPVYPPLARQARIQGTVRFNVVIDKEGRVQNLTLISGHPLLVASAKDAVQQWIYKPTLLNGEPVMVMTTVDVNFTLSQ